MGLIAMAQAAVNRAWRLGRKETSVGNSLELFREIYGGRSSSAGLSITTMAALGVPVVFACTRVLAEDVAGLPVKVYRKQQNGAKAPDDSHAAAQVLRRPNDWQTGVEFRETLMIHAALTGNGFAYVNRRPGGDVLELIPMLPHRIEIAHDKPFEAPRYRFLPEKGSPIDLSAGQVLHLRGPSWNAAVGMEITALARDTIGLALAAERHGAKTFANGGRIAGVLSSDLSLGPEQIAAIRDSWEQTYGGEGGAGKTAILFGGLKWQAVAMEADKGQFLETRKFQVEEIARAFRVFPQVIGLQGTTAGYASVEQFFLAHVMHSLVPWVRRVEECFDRTLLTDRDRDRGYYTKLSVQGLMRGDARTRSTFYGAGIKDGWLTRNEARGFEDLDPLPGLDLPLRPLNMGDGTTAPDPETPPAPPAS